MSEQIYKILNNPYLYKLVQNIFGPGANRQLVHEIQTLIKSLPRHDADKKLLDIGCGPVSWLSKIGFQPIGLDLEQRYVDAYVRNGGVAFQGSVDELPFSESSFQGVWCIGVFHHLPDDLVEKAIEEAFRVCDNDGYVAILDAVLPNKPLMQPIAHMLRKADRGRFMRNEAQLRSLLPSCADWKIRRFCYSYTGLEMLSMTAIKS